jgi:hypothetical protein
MEDLRPENIAAFLLKVIRRHSSRFAGNKKDSGGISIIEQEDDEEYPDPVDNSSNNNKSNSKHPSIASDQKSPLLIQDSIKGIK